MPAVAGELRFYADESILGVGKALSIARRDLVHPGHALVPALPLGILDPEWIPVVGQMDLVVIARDRRIRTKPGELQLLHQHRLRVFWIAGKRDLSTWDNLKLLVNRWDDLEATMQDRPTGPWFFGITQAGVSEIALREPHDEAPASYRERLDAGAVATALPANEEPASKREGSR